MAYGVPYFPTGGYNSYGQQYPTSPPMQQSQITTFINVPSQDVAYRWNTPPNTTTNFINENEGCLYKKSVGMSILEPPVFEIYDIVKRTTPQEQQQQEATTAVAPDMSEYMTKTEFESYKTIIDDMQKIVKELNGDG